MTPPIVKNKEAKSKEEKASGWVIASIKNYYTMGFGFYNENVI